MKTTRITPTKKIQSRILLISIAVLALLVASPLGFRVASVSAQTTEPANLVDSLNDFSRVFAFSDAAAFYSESVLPELVGNDSARLVRGRTGPEWATWRLDGLSQFTATAYFWEGEAISDFIFLASPDDEAYTPVLPAISVQAGNWSRVIYSLDVPEGTNFVRVVFPNNSYNWTPQLGEVRMAASVPTLPPSPTPAPSSTPELPTPTLAPTLIPTQMPTETPVPPIPTSLPTATPEPTAIPTSTSVAIPTATPTATPTSTPTAAPTAIPTQLPTAIPMAVALNDDPQLISIKTIANPRAIGSWGGSTQVEANPRAIGSWGGPNSDGYRKNQQALAALGLDRVGTLSTGEGIVVAVLDTGFQLDHPMLAGAFTEVRYDFVDRDRDPTDVKDGRDNDGNRLVDEAYGHGTHVTGIIRLIAPNAKVMPLRVLNADGDGNLANLVAAIDFASSNGAKIINLSLGATQNIPQLQAAVQRALSRGALVIAAAGNLDFWPKQYPAAYNCAVAVTSSGQISNFLNKITNGSAGWIDFAPPGERIYSTFPGSTYATWSGSSMATPIVAATAALVWSRYPNANARQVIQLMNATSDVLKAGMSLIGLIDLTQATFVDVAHMSSLNLSWDGSFRLPYIRRSPDVGNSLHNGDNFFNGRYSSALKKGGALSDCSP